MNIPLLGASGSLAPLAPAIEAEPRLDNELVNTIRASIENDQALSTLGRNVLVEQDIDMFMLNGLVASDEEKYTLGRKVAGFVGVDHVVNNLVVQK